MNKVISIHTIRFFVLILAQVLICNHINFMGNINPYVYILFVAFYPVQNNRLLFLFFSFLLGISIDMLADSGGIHAASILTIAYARPIFLKFAFGSMYHNIKFDSTELGSKITYIALLTILHHFIFFSLEVFSISKTILVLQKTLFSSIFTILLCVILSIIFSRNTK
ncbi:rod shape-determining protein MreD [Postechiella marina]|uniref:Rod shape-determining protein MreD n=1 Tax=Postechiella marina TaxID=943941 RepID=A0ABP8CBB2_9FLAO